MRGLSKITCRATVVISGMDVNDITEADPIATVTIDAPSDGEQLARFMGMCAVAMLRATRKTVEMTEPFAKQGWIAAAELVAAPPDVDLADFSIAEGVRPENVAEVVEHEMMMEEVTGKLSAETMLTIAFPRVGSDESRAGKKRRFGAELHEGRKGGAWVRLRSRNAMISAEGILCMLEQIAHEQPREIAERVAKVCQRLFEVHEELGDKATPLGFSQATEMYRLAGELSKADDPLTATISLTEAGRERRSAAAVDRDDGPVPGGPLDVEGWLSDAVTICISDFEPFTERLLELATLERLGIVSVFDSLGGERPKEEIGDDVIAALSNARMGYALRNRETQLLDHRDYVAHSDALATFLNERTGGDASSNLAAIHGVLRDVLVLRLRGGRDGLYQTTPGTTPAMRREGIEKWANEHFPSDDPRMGRDVTVDLLDYGYFLHRVFEIRPDCLEDWS